MSFFYRADQVMLERLLPDGNEQVGIYAQAFRNFDAVSNFCLLFAGLLLPIFAKMLKQKQPVEQLIKFSYILLIVPAIIIGISCVFYSKEIMTIMYHKHVEDSSPIFSFLMLSFIANATVYIFSTLLTANGNMKQLNLSAFIGVLICIILNFILIPRYAALGPAISNFVTFTFMAISMIAITQGLFKFNVNFKLIFKLISFLTGVIVLGFLCKMYFVNWVYGFFIMMVISLALAFGIRLFSFVQMFRVIKESNE